jgi:Icc protein
LCGHKHRPWIWNLGALQIAYAGTASSWRYRGVFDDTYNIINVDRGKIEIDIKVVGGKRQALSEIIKKYEPSPSKNNLV